MKLRTSTRCLLAVADMMDLLDVQVCRDARSLAPLRERLRDNLTSYRRYWRTRF